MTAETEPSRRVLVFLPTYEEAGTVERIHTMIRDNLAEADILFIDDNSPDGTGDILDNMAATDDRLHVLHRPGKLGVGSAHQHGIAWAYDHGYDILITMDSDFAHSPEYLESFVAKSAVYDIVVGTRFESADSLVGWNSWRRAMTHFAHFLTRTLLGIPYDATGAFRLYRLDRVPRAAFERVRAGDYAFFFESLQVLVINGLSVGEVSIRLPARTYGSSKMRFRDIFRGFAYLLRQAVRAKLRRASLIVAHDDPEDRTGSASEIRQAWDSYWDDKQDGVGGLYQKIAVFYRRYIIKRSLDLYLERYFPVEADLLHAGCGNGQMDEDVVRRYHVTALDISPVVLRRYAARHRDHARIVEGNLFELPLADAAFDGVYNLGVMEHFSQTQIDRLLGELRRVVRPGGRLVLFWPPEFGLSVWALKLIHFVLNRILRKNIELHPPEPSRIRSRRDIAARLSRNRLELEAMHFGPLDAFTHAIVVARRTPENHIKKPQL